MPLNSVYFTMCTKIICNNNVCTEHTLKITVHLQHYIEQKLFSLNYPKFTHQLKLLRVEFFCSYYSNLHLFLLCSTECWGRY